jgi:hypothetical protein
VFDAPRIDALDDAYQQGVIMDKPLYAVLEDAIWQALDSEQGMPHSGVDPAYVIPEFLRLLDEAGYTVTPKNPM